MASQLACIREHRLVARVPGASLIILNDHTKGTTHMDNNTANSTGGNRNIGSLARDIQRRLAEAQAAPAPTPALQQQQQPPAPAGGGYPLSA
jgi:hypothetical protein